MSALSRIICLIVLAGFFVGPVQVLAQATTATVQGLVTSNDGAAIAGATVNLTGPSNYTTTTDPSGAFSISNVAPGIYRLTVTKAGYETAQDDLAVVSGETESATVRMGLATFTSLRTVAQVTVRGRGNFNTSTASVSTISASTFQDQAQFSVNHVLDQIPGVQISYPTSSANAASPGAIVVPNIRGGLSNETATLLDGHPLAVVDYADYVTTFLAPSFMFSYAEVIKGPGAMSPQTNYAIGGTVNFHTKDPTLTATPDFTFGVLNDSGGTGTYANFGISDTLGRLGFVVDVADIDEPNFLDGSSTWFNPYNPNGVLGYCGYTPTGSWISAVGCGNVAESNDYRAYLPGTITAPYRNYGLVACCYTYQGAFTQVSELIKLRYAFSSATRVTLSYLGTESTAEQNANTQYWIPSNFYPATGEGYSGSLAPGSSLIIPSGGPYPITAPETNSEPIVQAEVATTLGSNTVLMRYYHAAIDRLIDESTDTPFVPEEAFYSLYVRRF